MKLATRYPGKQMAFWKKAYFGIALISAMFLVISLF